MPPENTIVVTEFTLPTYIFANGQVTGVGFSNPENILLVDGDVASSNANQGAASDITVAGYNFMYGGESIPQGAVIVGIEMEIIGYEGAQTVPQLTLTVALYDNVNSADNFYPYTDPITELGQDMTTLVIGTPTYLFNTNLSVDQVNNIKMNLTANGDISLDSFLVRVYFYIPATTTPPTPDDGTCVDCDSPIQVQAMALALPFLVGDTVFYLQKGSFAYPNGVPVQPGDVGACGGHIPFVFDQGKNKQTNGNFEENAMLDTTIGSWSVLASGIIAVDLGSIDQRGLDFKTPGTHVTALMSDHDANSEVIISNNTPYNLTLVRRCQVGTVFSAPIEVDKDGSQIVLPAVKLNFIGPGVTVVENGDNPEQADITIAGAGGTQPPQVVGTGSGTSGNTQVTSLTYTLPVSGTNRGALVQVTIPSGVSISSVTVGGVSATHIVTESASGIQVQQYFLVAPAVGTQNVVVTLGTAAYIVSGAECLIGVDQSSSTGATHSATGTGTAISNTLTTTVDNSLVIDAIGTTAAPLIFTPGAGQSDNWIHDAVTDTVEGASSIQSAGTEPDSVVMSWTISKSTLWVSAAVEIKGITTSSSSIDLQTNGVDNTDQSKLNLIAGTNMTLTPDGSGGVTFSSSGGSGSDEKVKIDSSDTTPGYLDPKIEIVSSDSSVTIVKTIQNPSGNEKISYDLSVMLGGGGGGGGTKLAIDTTPFTQTGPGSTTAYTVNIPGGTLGTNNAIRFVITGVNADANSQEVVATYGGQNLIPGSVFVESGTNTGQIIGYVIANGATNAQVGSIMTASGGQTSNSAINGDIDTLTVDSTTDQNLVVTVTITSSGTISGQAIVVEKISSGGSGNQLFISTTPAGSSSSSTPVTAYSFSLPGGTLGISNAVKIQVFGIDVANEGNISIKYGGSVIGVVSYGDGASSGSTVGTFEAYIIAAGATNSQLAEIDATQNQINTASQNLNSHTTLSIDSTTSETIEVDIYSTGSFTSGIDVNGCIITLI